MRQARAFLMCISGRAVCLWMVWRRVNMVCAHQATELIRQLRLELAALDGSDLE